MPYVYTVCILQGGRCLPAPTNTQEWFGRQKSIDVATAQLNYSTALLLTHAPVSESAVCKPVDTGC